jgi:exonuclease SbcC
MEGFSGFRAPATVSFEDADLVVFVGPTGSGKSSIVDAIAFALYGCVPRYDDRRAVEPAIHQLCQEAKVRLDFEVAGRHHTAVRIVRRTKTGATTSEARLLRRNADGTETILAGTERELSAAVIDLLGLDFDQFTKTCVLPQGDFADFLHADKRDRQRLLRQLLDVDVFEAMGRLARSRSDQASTRVLFLQEQLDADPPMRDEALAELQGRETSLAALAERLPELIQALSKAAAEMTALADHQAKLADLGKRLGNVKVPAEVGKLDARIAGAQSELDQARAALDRARGERDEAKSAKDAGPDGAALHQALHAAEQLRDRQTELATAEPEATAARAAADAASGDAEAAVADLAKAEGSLRSATEAAGLEGVIAGLVAGEPCPVCRQVVRAIPDHDVGAELATAKDMVGRARARAKEAIGHHHALEVAASQRAERVRMLTETCTDLQTRVPEDTDLDELRRRAALADQLADAYEAALEEVTRAEVAEEGAKTTRKKLERDETRVRKDLAATRDAVAERRPPASVGESLAVDWEALAAWARSERVGVMTEHAEVGDHLRAIGARRTKAARAIETACQAVDVELTKPDAAAVAVATAMTQVAEQRKRALDRRAKVAEIQAEMVSLEERAAVHRMLGNLLKADGFERWLLQVALDRLVRRATDRLRDLSGGQFSLISDDGDFLIRDHRNADEIRNVRTLSGGETFLTSLALALALAEDIAELATEGAPRIESMFLDEGFGTLDPDTLEVVAAAIEELSASGRLIGIVTHIRDLADRMPVRFEVHKDATTSHVERVEV